ncbi:uncharacterized protein LOC132607722 [Lycium barbarum]|uniref:uncharacterized protein LOC132607722 n=1 Tax=Lycium barbarum TaxID=112863 RepID=UPI00293F0F9D|nr:uncharacterized protein LOC132607722 [Lycium barbarum]
MRLLEKIISAAKIFFGFNMDNETTKGQIDLPVEAGGVTKLIKLLGLGTTYQQTPTDSKNDVRSNEVEDDYGVPRYFRPPDDSDATKSTAEELEQITLHSELPKRKVYLGMGLTPELKEIILAYFRDKNDCFAWSHKDMKDILLDVATHKLGLDLSFPSVCRQKHPIAEVCKRFVKEEIARLLNNGSIREVKYPDWLVIMVIVQKKGNKLRMCIDFKDLNKACPKDSFQLSSINQMIDAMAGHEVKECWSHLSEARE